MDSNKPRPLEWTGAFAIVAIMGMMAWIVIAPYFGLVVSESDRTLVSTVQNTVQNGFLIVLGALFGQSIGTAKKDNIIDKLATSNASAQAALNPQPANPAPADAMSAGPVDASTP